MIGSDNKDSNVYRSGRYVTQLNGYAAFIPNPLPPIPAIQLDDELVQLLAQSSLALGRLDSASEILPNSELFVAMYVQKEAVLSS